MRLDEAARRSYWADQFDEAHDFMMKVMDYPVDECGEKMISLPEVSHQAGVEVIFSERPHVDNMNRIFVLREGQIDNFIDAVRMFNNRGWILKVEDAYRSRAMQKGLTRQPYIFDYVIQKVVWELDGSMPDTDFLFKRLLTIVAQIPKTGTHMSGSAIDISVFDKNTGEEVDRGGPYIEISELTPMSSPFISSQAKSNRQKITAIFQQNGFVAYPYEFWHYSSGDAYEQYLLGTGLPARYGAVDYDENTGRIIPIENPTHPLNSLEDIRAEVQASLERCHK